MLKSLRIQPYFFGSLDLLQDYLKIAMESKNVPNHKTLGSTANSVGGIMPPIY
jgi:hypothetical protein